MYQPSGKMLWQSLGFYSFMADHCDVIALAQQIDTGLAQNLQGFLARY